MKQIRSFSGLAALSALATFMAAPAFADGKAAIKPPIVEAPAPLQTGRVIRPEPRPAPLQRRIVSREITSAPTGLKLDSDLIAAMSGGVGTGVTDGIYGGGGLGTGFTGRSDFGRSARFRAARQFQRRRSSRRVGRRGAGRR